MGNLASEYSPGGIGFSVWCSELASWRDWQVVFATILVAATILWAIKDQWGQHQMGPSVWPIVGGSVEQFRNIDRLHDWLLTYFEKDSSRAPTVIVPMPFGHTCYYVADPANVEHILKTNFSNYPKGENFNSVMETLLGNGIFNSDGEMWRKQRKTASSEFAMRSLRDFSTVVFNAKATKLVDLLSHVVSKKDVIDMQDLFMRLTLESIGKIGFGVEIDVLSSKLPLRENKFAKAFDSANEIVVKRFLDPLWKVKRFMRVGSEAVLNQCVKEIDEFTYNVIIERKLDLENSLENLRNQVDPEISEITSARRIHERPVVKNVDILSRFITFRDEKGEKLSDKTLRDIVLNFLIAGRDTTAVTLSWLVYELIQHPLVADRIYSEMCTFENSKLRHLLPITVEPPSEESVSESFEDCSAHRHDLIAFAALLTHESLKELPYLHAVLNETIRLHPAVPLDPKGIESDDVLPDGTLLKRGTGQNLVSYSAYCMARLPYIWGPDAKLFNPDRWFKNGDIQAESPYKFCAFQAGPRTCLGHLVKYRLTAILSMAHGLRVTVSSRGNPTVLLCGASQ